MANTEQQDGDLVLNQALDLARQTLGQYVTHLGTHVEVDDPQRDAIVCVIGGIELTTGPDQRIILLSLAAYELAKLGWKP